MIRLPDSGKHQANKNNNRKANANAKTKTRRYAHTSPDPHQATSLQTTAKQLKEHDTKDKDNGKICENSVPAQKGMSIEASESGYAKDAVLLLHEEACHRLVHLIEHHV